MTEKWRPVPRWIGYEVSNQGRVRNQKTDRILKQIVSSRGYLRVHLSNNGVAKKIPVHRLVCEAFHGPPRPGHQVRHWNGVKTDNRLDNLMWGTSAENAQDRNRLGEQEYCKGQAHGHAKLSDVDIAKIHAMYFDGTSQYKIAKDFDISQGQVSRIVNRKRWKHLTT